MPVDYLRGGRLFVLHAVGQYPAQDVKDTLDEILAVEDFPDDARLMLDLARADSVLQHSIPEMKGIAAHFVPRASRFGGRISLLVSGLARYGLMRMASMWMDQADIDARVFRDENEARAWLLDDRSLVSPPA